MSDNIPYYIYSFNSKATSLFYSKSQFLIEHLKGGVGREVNAIEACVSPVMCNKLLMITSYLSLKRDF